MPERIVLLRRVLPVPERLGIRKLAIGLCASPRPLRDKRRGIGNGLHGLWLTYNVLSQNLFHAQKLLLCRHKTSDGDGSPTCHDLGDLFGSEIKEL